jgi:hypothetical protein
MPEALGYDVFSLRLHWRKMSTPVVRDDTTIPLTSINQRGSSSDVTIQRH